MSEEAPCLDPGCPCCRTHTRIERALEDLIGKLADELEVEVRHRYDVPIGEEPHPAMKLRFERDMNLVKTARRRLP